MDENSNAQPPDAEDFDSAVASADWPQVAPIDYWENRYSGDQRTWSGNPNKALVETVSELPRGRALDLGCGEGADAIWLAQNGWRTTGIDISSNAVGKATSAARMSGVPESDLDFVAADLTTWTSAEPFDLVTASFLHSPVELTRQEILRRITELVAPGGHLLLVSHADFPPWADQAMREQVHRTMSRGGSVGPHDSGHADGHGHGHGHGDHVFLTPQQEVDELALDPDQWSVVVCETRSREATGPTGETATLEDGVVLLRRTPA